MRHVCLTAIFVVALGFPAIAEERQLITYADLAPPQYIDAMPAGPSLGDMYVRRGNVRLEPEGPVVGEYYSQATTVNLDPDKKTSARSYLAEAILPGGSIYEMDIVQTEQIGPVNEGHKHEGSVVGGTGEYAGIRGTYVVEVLPGGKTARVTRKFWTGQ